MGFTTGSRTTNGYRALALAACPTFHVLSTSPDDAVDAEAASSFLQRPVTWVTSNPLPSMLGGIRCVVLTVARRFVVAFEANERCPPGAGLRVLWRRLDTTWQPCRSRPRRSARPGNEVELVADCSLLSD